MADGALVLVVDDDKDIRECMEHVLTAAGYAVQTAASALDALAALPTDWPAAIVLDQRMYPVDGITFLEQVYSQWGRVPPVVLLTAYLAPRQTSEVSAAGRRLNLHRVITKPFAVEDLLEAVAAAVAEEETGGA